MSTAALCCRLLLLAIEPIPPVFPAFLCLSVPPLQDVYSEISSQVKRRVAVDAAAGTPEAAALVKYIQGGWGDGDAAAAAFVPEANSCNFIDADRPALLCSSHCQHAVAACQRKAAPSPPSTACLPASPSSPSLLLPCSGPQAYEADGDGKCVWGHLCGRLRAGKRTAQQPLLLPACSAATAMDLSLFPSLSPAPTLVVLMRPRTLPHPTPPPASRSRPQIDKRLKERESALQVG